MRLTKSVAAGAAAALFLTVLGVSDLQAQSQALSVNIPFEFSVADRKLPAGTYTVQQTPGGAIRIFDSEGHNATVLSNPIWKRARGGVEMDSLIFTHYGNDYFLSEARWRGYKDARGVIKSRKEMELAKTLTPDRVNMAGVVR